MESSVRTYSKAQGARDPSLDSSKTSSENLGPNDKQKSQDIFVISWEVLLIIVPVILIFLFLFKIIKLEEPRSSTPLPAVEKNFGSLDILYRESGDSQGRTIFYKNKEISSDASRKETEGIGWVEITLSTERAKTAINAQYKGVEQITESKDKYIKLAFPGGANIYKLRILGGQESKSTAPLSVYASETGVFVEDLNSLVNSRIDVAEYLGPISSLSDNELAKILIVNDAVTAIFARVDSGAVVFDVNGNPVIERIYIRRFDGKSAVEKEIRRNFQN